jgi:hypothetical protein
MNNKPLYNLTVKIIKNFPSVKTSSERKKIYFMLNSLELIIHNFIYKILIFQSDSNCDE